jgi:hypothetical protein
MIDSTLVASAERWNELNGCMTPSEIPTMAVQAKLAAGTSHRRATCDRGGC